MSAAFDHRLIRLLVVDKHFFVRLGLADALNAEPDICVVAETDNAAGAIRLFGELRPDVVLLDGQLADSMGTETLATLRQEFPEARVLLLSINDGPKEAGSALASGASGYLTKNASLAQL
ncbi:MAG: response regulator transcription factor, partial [Verrucomicrobiota bacterium]